jgi:hypothetical protein
MAVLFSGGAGELVGEDIGGSGTGRASSATQSGARGSFVSWDVVEHPKSSNSVQTRNGKDCNTP